jgi:hypothetical protein
LALDEEHLVAVCRYVNQSVRARSSNGPSTGCRRARALLGLAADGLTDLALAPIGFPASPTCWKPKKAKPRRSA